MSDNNNNNNNNSSTNSGRSNNNNNNNRNNNNRNNNYRGRRNNNNNSGNSNRNNKNNNANKKKGACEELGYNTFDCSSRKNIETCKETLKAIAIHVGSGRDYGKESSNIKYVIEHLKDPPITEPEALSANEAKDKTKWFQYTEEYKRYLDRKENLEFGKRKLYSLIWGQCTQMMKNELQATDNYNTMSENEDPIALIKNIKGVTHNFRDQKYNIGSMWHAYKQLFQCIQKEDEDIKTFFERYKNHMEVIENNGGELGTETKLLKHDETFNSLNESEQQDEDNIKAAKERNREKFLAYGLLACCDKRRFGNLTEDLENNYTFGDNKYPTTQQKSYDYLMNYKKYKPRNKNSNNNNNNTNQNENRDGVSFAQNNRGLIIITIIIALDDASVIDAGAIVIILTALHHDQDSETIIITIVIT